MSQTRHDGTNNHWLHDIPTRAYPYADHPQDCPMGCCNECHFMFSPAPCPMCGLTGEDG